MLHLMLLMFAAIAIVLLLWRSFSSPEPDDAKAVTQHMRQCHHCGLHIPESEAVQRHDHFFCCDEHADHAEPH